MSSLWKEAADLVIEPDVAGFAYDDFKRADNLIRAGEVAMHQALPAVRKWLETPAEEPANSKAVGAKETAKGSPAARPVPMPAD